MTKYRALVDVPPEIKKGDIVNFNDPLVDGYKKLFEKVGADDEVEDTDKTDNTRVELTVNPDRNALKARATELNVDFAPNISTDKLVELVKEAQAKADADAADESHTE